MPNRRRRSRRTLPMSLSLAVLLLATFSVSSVSKVHALPSTGVQLNYVAGTPTISCQTLFLEYTSNGQAFVSVHSRICTAISATVVPVPENDANFDYYTVKLSTFVLNGTSVPSCWGFCSPSPPGEWVTDMDAKISYPSGDTATQLSQSGTTSSGSQVSWSISGCVPGGIACVGASGSGPAQQVVQSINIGSPTTVEWSVTIPGFLAWATNNILSTEADFGFVLQVPEGQSFGMGFNTGITLTYYDANAGGGGLYYTTTHYSNSGQLPVDPVGIVYSSQPLYYGDVGALVQTDLHQSGNTLIGTVYLWSGYGSSSTSITNSVGDANAHPLTISNGQALFLFNIHTTPYWMALGCSVTVSTGAISCFFFQRTPDVNHDGIVNIVDLATCAAVFGTSQGQSGFNPNCDMNADGTINILDLSTLSFYFGDIVF